MHCLQSVGDSVKDILDNRSMALKDSTDTKKKVLKSAREKMLKRGQQEKTLRF